MCVCVSLPPDVWHSYDDGVTWSIVFGGSSSTSNTAWGGRGGFGLWSVNSILTIGFGFSGATRKNGQTQEGEEEEERDTDT